MREPSQPAAGSRWESDPPATSTQAWPGPSRESRQQVANEGMRGRTCERQPCGSRLAANLNARESERGIRRVLWQSDRVPYDDNPAGRLHALLSSLRRSANPQSVSSMQAWADLLGVPYQDLVGYTSAMSDVLQSSADAAARIESLEDVDVDLLLRWQEKTEVALANSLALGGSPVNQVLAQYDETTLSQLEFCSYELHRRYRDRSISADKLDELIGRLIELRADVESEEANFPVEVRGLLLMHLSEMETALRRYGLTGIGGLEAAFDRTVGHLCRRPDLGSQATQSTVWPKVAATLAAISLVVTTATQVLALPPALHDVFQQPAQPAELVDDSADHGPIDGEP